MSSDLGFEAALQIPFATLQYRDIALCPQGSPGSAESAERHSGDESTRRTPGGMTEEEFVERIRKERAEAALQAEHKIRMECEQNVLTVRSALAETLARFIEERDDYFSRAEAEIVQLSLSIAAKILHREAQVDPMLLATLVRMAIDRMRDGSTVNVRVPPQRAGSWQQYFESCNMGRVNVVADSQLADHDCVLETGVGSAHLGLDTQLKEVEQGFFDLLALRPAR